MKKIQDLLQLNIKVKASQHEDERTALVYEIAKYFNEKPNLWFMWVKKSGVYTNFLRQYFEDAKSAVTTKKTQAKFLMAKLFPKK